MNDTVEIRVPDIGDFKDIDVIEVLVKPGDAVEKETSLITVESDKATMEIPSPAAGVVKELKLKIGDKVSEGTLIMLLEPAGAATAAPAPQPAVAPAATQSLSAPPLPKGGGRCTSRLEQHDQRTLGHLVADFELQFLHHAGGRRRDFHRGLVRFHRDE
jgi:pyruvate/2-oxoglutarate dehydrogenase complex dihydrolipoamide acyltransferase (E2) component